MVLRRSFIWMVPISTCEWCANVSKRTVWYSGNGNNSMELEKKWKNAQNVELLCYKFAAICSELETKRCKLKHWAYKIVAFIVCLRYELSFFLLFYKYKYETYSINKHLFPNTAESWGMWFHIKMKKINDYDFNEFKIGWWTT